MCDNVLQDRVDEALQIAFGCAQIENEVDRFKRAINIDNKEKIND